MRLSFIEISVGGTATSWHSCKRYLWKRKSAELFVLNTLEISMPMRRLDMEMNEQVVHALYLAEVEFWHFEEKIFNFFRGCFIPVPLFFQPVHVVFDSFRGLSALYFVTF